ncbi:MAG: hypothetical protein GQ574_07610 [Crocinitomix sp.]|nr:hypothetical protein [Crocinitomix sp.]
MSWTQKLRNPFIQQYAIEIVFPLAGYFFFDWDILIIGVYYLIDHLCSQILFFRRAHWVNVKGPKPLKNRFLLSAIFAFLTFLLAEIIAFNYLVMETQEMTQKAVLEGFYDFTISELWILFPLVLFVYHLKDQFTFYARRQYLKLNYKRYVLWEGVNSLIILILIAIVGLLWMKFSIHNAAIIFIFIGLKIGFDLTVKRFNSKQSLID